MFLNLKAMRGGRCFAGSLPQFHAEFSLFADGFRRPPVLNPQQLQHLCAQLLHGGITISGTATDFDGNRSTDPKLDLPFRLQCHAVGEVFFEAMYGFGDAFRRDDAVGTVIVKVMFGIK